MINSRNFTSKTFKLKISRENWTLEDFLAYFDLSEKEFFEKFEKTFTSRARSELLHQMESNAKKRVKSKRFDDDIQPESDQDQDQFEEEPSQYFQPMDLDNPEASEDITTEEEFSEILVLRERQNSLVLSISEDELKHKELVSANASFRNELRSIYDKVISLKETISALYDQATVLKNNISQNEEEMKELNSKLGKDREELDKVSMRIDELNKVTIFLYEDGSIEISDPTLEFPDSWSSVFCDLLANPESLNGALTLNQLKQLSKLKVLVETLTQEYELIIENEEVMKLWEEIK